MKSKKRLVIATLISSVTSLLIAILFHFVFKESEDLEKLYTFLVDFAFAVFGSALLGFIMSLTEYFVSKKQALENYYLAAIKVLNIFSRAEFFLMSEPKDLLKDFYSNNSMNRNIFKSNGHNATTNNKLFKYMKSIWEKTLDIPEPEFSEYAHNQFQKEIKGYNSKIISTINSYINISEENISFLDTAYAEFDFIFGNKKIRKEIFTEIHKPFFDYKNIIDEKAFHFRIYLQEKHGNTPVIIEFIDELQKEFFNVNKSSDDSFEIYIVHRKFFDDMDNKIENLRCQINNEDYKPIKHYACLQYRKQVK